MTDEEFKTWTKRFFVRFPSVREWLNNSSPDPAETLRYWRAVLKAYSLDEAADVLDQWLASGSRAFEAYDRDNIPLVVKSTIDKQRQRQRDREQVNRERHYRNAARGDGSAPVAIVSTLSRNGLKDAYLRLRPLHQKLLDDELTEHEYARLVENVTAEV